MKRALTIGVFVLMATFAALSFVAYKGFLIGTQKEFYKSRYIVHAGGQLDNGGEVIAYTNSYDTLDNLYNMGNRVSEFDFLYTSDGEIVCAHNDKESWAKGFPFTEAPTMDEFLNSKSFGSFTPMSLDMLADYMRKHRDLLIVTDVKDDNIQFCEYLKSKYPDLMSQFIIQIYHEDEYAPIKAMGFESIIYTLYKADDEEIEPEHLKLFLKEHDLTGVTFWESWADDSSELFKAIKSSGVPMYVHTVNDMDKMEEMFGKGISGIYTDVVDPSMRY